MSLREKRSMSAEEEEEYVMSDEEEEDLYVEDPPRQGETAGGEEEKDVDGDAGFHCSCIWSHARLGGFFLYLDDLAVRVSVRLMHMLRFVV